MTLPRFATVVAAPRALRTFSLLTGLCMFLFFDPMCLPPIGSCAKECHAQPTMEDASGEAVALLMDWAALAFYPTSLMNCGLFDQRNPYELRNSRVVCSPGLCGASNYTRVFRQIFCVD